MTYWVGCKRVPKLLIFNAYGTLPPILPRGVLLPKFLVFSGLGEAARGKYLI